MNQLYTELNKGPKNVVQVLKEQARQDQIFAAVLNKFASRQRTRGRVTVRALKMSMELEGHNIKFGRYGEVFKFLAGLGFGTLDYDSKGRIVALNNIKVTLQSIGKAATETDTISSFRPKNQYTEIPTPPEPTATYKAYLTILVNEAPVVIQGPDNLVPESLGEFLVDFSRIRRKAEGTP